MTASKQGSSFALVSLALSMLGLGLLPLLFLNPPPSLMVPGQKLLVGIAFASICILGIIAGVTPTHCSRASYKKKKTEPNQHKFDSITTNAHHLCKRGHHPTCDQYTGHVLRIQTRIVCAGCTGLVTGAIIALIGTILFFFGNFYFPLVIGIFWLGWVFVAVGLLQHYIYQVFHVQQGEVRFLVNVLFVLGAFLLLATQMQITNNLVLGSYLLPLILYWIFTRIVMSRRSHQRICAQCRTPTCPLSEV